MQARLVVFGLVASAGWVGSFAGFRAYVSWFSETGRSGDWLVLGLAWFAVLVGLSASFALAATAVLVIADRVRGHA